MHRGLFYTMFTERLCVFFHNLMHMGKKTETKEKGVEKFLCRYYITVLLHNILIERTFVKIFSLVLLSFLVLCASGVEGANSTVIHEHVMYVDGQKHTFRKIKNEEKITSIKVPFGAIPLLENEFILPQFALKSLKLSRTGKVGVGFKEATSEGIILHTHSLCDCVGISVWNTETRAASLFHFYEDNLRDNPNYLQEIIAEIRSFSFVTSYLKIYLASGYLNNVVTIINRLQAEEFNISGLYVPDALREDSEFDHDVYVGEGVPLAFMPTPDDDLHGELQRRPNLPYLSMTIDGEMGEVRVYPRWLQ